jgi:23S rRNA (pseudouridine1915-N3)-methyltransferase
MTPVSVRRILGIMKLHIVTVGQPKLPYARQGWDEYTKRLGRFHHVRASHLADKHADDSQQFRQAIGNAYTVALEVTGQAVSSEELSQFLDKRAQEGREVCFIIGGPDGLPADIIQGADWQWSLSRLTFPHDLAMLVLAETLYRSSTISAGHPYHRG